MREVEFRGKDIKTNQWVYGGYYKYLTKTPCPIGNNIAEKDYQYLIIESGFSDWNMPKPLVCFEVRKETVGQYIGFTDRKGIKIYEGDIVRVKDLLSENNIYNTISFIGVVKFNNASFYISDESVNHYRWIDYEVEVIGNEIENKELLEDV